MGLTNQESKVIAVPTLIDFTNDKNESVEIFVEKAQCGNTFTICMTSTLKKIILKKRGSILQVVKLQNYQLNNVINCLNKYEIHFQMMEHFGDVDVTSMVN